MNNTPHLGNLIGAVLSADVYARFCRSNNRETLYICGSDEHGTTTEAKAREEGISAQELCDKYHEHHKELYQWFSISFDHYGRTNHPTQIARTQDIFLKLLNNGFVQERVVEQLYDEEAQTFLADRFIEGTCPHCSSSDARGDQCDTCGKLLDPQELINPKSKLSGSTPTTKKVKHLFLSLDKLQEQLTQFAEQHNNEWTSNAVKTTNAWFNEGLRERAITRDLSWGVPVPLQGWEDKRFYVWFDAPIGYISITEQHVGDAWVEWWKKPSDVSLTQFMGKDNIPFHTILFPASLLGTQEEWVLVNKLAVTEYLNYEDGKFSKSRNTGVFADDAKNTGIPSDVYRYYLLSIRPETQDSQFSWKELGEKNNNELLATLGNLVNRTLVFINNNLKGTIPNKPSLAAVDIEFWSTVTSKEKEVAALLDQLKLRDALKKIMDIAREANAYYQRSEPWKTLKETPEQANNSLYILAHVVRDLAILIEPYLPVTSARIFEQLSHEPQKWNSLGVLDLDGHTIGRTEHLFTKIEEEQVLSLKKQFSGAKKCLLNLRVAHIVSVTPHPNADKLLIIQLDVGTLGTRQVVAGLAPYYEAQELVGKHVVLVANLKEAKLRGELSQGMLLAAQDEQENVGVILSQAPPGTPVVPIGQEAASEIIDYKEFCELSIQAQKNSVTLQGQELLANTQPVRSDKNVVGTVH